MIGSKNLVLSYTKYVWLDEFQMRYVYALYLVLGEVGKAIRKNWNKIKTDKSSL